jgi:hypothetical protein
MRESHVSWNRTGLLTQPFLNQLVQRNLFSGQTYLMLLMYVVTEIEGVLSSHLFLLSHKRLQCQHNIDILFGRDILVASWPQADDSIWPD